MNGGIRRRLGGGLLAVAAAAAASVAAAGPAEASCLPAQFKTFSDDPDTVLMAGTVAQVAASQVAHPEGPDGDHVG